MHCINQLLSEHEGYPVGHISIAFRHWQRPWPLSVRQVDCQLPWCCHKVARVRSTKASLTFHFCIIAFMQQELCQDSCIYISCQCLGVYCKFEQQNHHAYTQRKILQRLCLFSLFNFALNMKLVTLNCDILFKRIYKFSKLS